MVFILDPKKFSDYPPEPSVDGSEIVPIVKGGDNSAATIQTLWDGQPQISDATQAALDEKQDALGYTPENVADKGNANGYAELDADGFVPTSQLPSYVDDVIEVANFAALPVTGEVSKIYVTLNDNKTYRWSGSQYVVISDTLALGETSSTAYRGDRGKTAYDHSQLTSGNPHNVTKSDVGLSNADNTSDANKPVSIATQALLDLKQKLITVSATPPLNPSVNDLWIDIS